MQLILRIIPIEPKATLQRDPETSAMRRSLSVRRLPGGAPFSRRPGRRGPGPLALPAAHAFDVTDRKLVTVQGAFTESFFTPEVVMKSDAWAVVGPDGARKSR
jgi:hypothetical protein